MSYVPNTYRYEEMQYRRCGKSGLQFPILSLGLWHNFGSIDDFQTSKKMLEEAFDRGITHFDLANNYGPPPGSAEESLGKVLQSSLKPHRNELIISTKAGYYMWPGPYGEWGSRKYLISSLHDSLKRLNIDYVDIFYSHRPDPNTPLEETMMALHDMVKQGKALYVGISNYPADESKLACSILKQLGTPCLIHQPKYNLLNRWVEKDLLNVATEEGFGIIPFSPLAQGVLTNKYIKGIPKGSRAAKESGFLQPNEITHDVIDKVVALNEVAKSRNQSLAQMSLAWLLRNPQVCSVLCGVSSIAQLHDNLEIMNNLEFSSVELAQINTILLNK